MGDETTCGGESGAAPTAVTGGVSPGTFITAEQCGHRTADPGRWFATCERFLQDGQVRIVGIGVREPSAGRKPQRSCERRSRLSNSMTSPGILKRFPDDVTSPV